MSLVEPSSKLFADPVRKRWTGAEYDRLVDVGAFDHQRLELIEGEIFKMSPMNDPHSMAITLVQNALLACFDTGQYTVKVQCPMRLGEDSRPEPDVALLAGGIRAHDRHPTTALLVVEVADSTRVRPRHQGRPLRPARAAGVLDHQPAPAGGRSLSPAERRELRAGPGAEAWPDGVAADPCFVRDRG
jgi:Uma2 family endonuclease